MASHVAVKEERDEYESILSSGTLNRAPNLVLLLRYICEKYFAGEADQIKEYNIAVEALGRPGDFDQKQNSIVRVEASRLRRRLAKYYENEGADRELCLEIPNGQYVPRFVRRDRKAEIQQQRETVLLAPPSEPVAVIPTQVVPTPQLSSQVRSVEGQLPKPKRRTLAIAIAISLAISVLAFFLIRNFSTRNETNAQTSSPAKTALPGVAGATPATDEVRIIASPSVQQYVDHTGNYWTGDRFAEGGELVAMAKTRLARTPDYPAFSGGRHGAFTYNIPVKPGLYELHLRFLESLFGEANLAGGGEASRLFNVSANGKDILNTFDIYCDAGGANIADERVFRNIEAGKDGKIVLKFTPIKDIAMVSSIELVPMQGPHIRPVRVVMQPEMLRLANGTSWGADRYSLGGQAILRHTVPAVGEESDLYRGERYGRFSYDIPVAPGRYSVSLYFTEAWFGEGLPGGAGASSRLFDIFANGVVLVRNLDVLKEAGGSNRALKKTFHGLEPNAQGKIELNFIPVKNYAFVNAIEVVDETK